MKIKKSDIQTYRKQFYKNNKINLGIGIGGIVIDAISTLGLSWFIQQLLDMNSENSKCYTIGQLVLMAFILVTISVISGMIMCYAKPKFIIRGIAQYKEYVFRNLVRKKMSAFTEEDTAMYISALTNDIQTIEQGYLVNIFTIMESIFTFCGALALMIWYSPILTLMAGILSVLPLIASFITSNEVAEAEKKVSDKNQVYTETIRDCLSGFAVIKAFKAENEILQLFSSNVNKLSKYQNYKYKKMILVQLLGSVAGVVAQLGVFIFGVYLALSGKKITIGTTMVFVQLMNYIISPIVTIPTCFAQWLSAKALICKIADALNDNILEFIKSEPFTLKQGINVKNLSFGYDISKEILHNINYNFRLGKKYAIVGKSGSGKSTLLNLLMASYQNYVGTIFYDDTELHEINSDNLYDIVSIIQQNVCVFNASIEDNITMFKTFPNEEIDRAIKLSGLSKLMITKGVNYLCGENGSGLSGGEKQRISIARSLLKKSQILLVDEATSSLDPETAYQVLNSILGLDDVTCIVVTHSLEANLMKQYDEIITLKNGAIVETGTFDSLIKRKGYFYSLYTITQ